MQQVLTEAQTKSITGQFHKRSLRLQIEGRRHQLQLNEAKAFDSKKDNNLQRFHKNLAMKKKEAVAGLCNSHYCSEGFDKKDNALTYLRSMLVKVANIFPTKTERDQCSV